MHKPDIRSVIKEYLQIIFQRKWLFLVPATATFIIVSMVGFILPKVYLASNLVMVEQVRATTPLVSDLAVTTTISARLNTINQEIVSRSNLIKVVKTLGFDRDIRNEGDIIRIVEDLQKTIKVSLVGSNLLQISCEGRNPQLLKRIVDTTTKFFIDKNLDMQSREVETAINFIQSQLDIYKTKLDESEAILKDFRSITMLDLDASPREKLTQLLGADAAATAGGNLPAANMSSSNVNIDRLVDFQNQLLQIEVSLSEALERKNLLEKQLAGQDEVIVSEVVKEASPVVKMLRQQQSDLEMELSNLLVDATEGHPRVREVRKKLSLVKARIEEEKELITSSEMSGVNPLYQELKGKLNNAEIEISSLRAKKRSLEELSVAFEKKLKDLPAKELERINITREYSIAASMYSMLLQRRETARITKRLEVLEKGTKFEVLDEARVPAQPIKPNKALISFFGLVLGLFVGAALVFIIEYADSSFRGIEDARTVLKEPVLGAVSQLLTREQSEFNRLAHKRRFFIGLAVFGVTLVTVLALIRIL
jgi:uncharacterized protein involved in exopolysaccharide biosynthesis